jgi:O-antigen polymerase
MNKNNNTTITKSGYIPIICICFALVLFCLNTSKFIYPSLQLYFSFTFCSIILAGLAGIWCMIKKNKIELSIPVILITVWGIYIIAHSIFVRPAEDYQLIYMLSGILYYYSLTFFFKKQLIRFEQIYVFFAWMAVLQGVVCLLQFAGLVNSGDPNFYVKGTFYNPNITAMYIVVSMPFFITKLIHEKKRLLNSIVLVLLFLALIALKCRTAYVGLVIIACIYFIKETQLRKRWDRVSKKLKFVIIFMTVALLSGLFTMLYFQKQASADGRVFVWKVSKEMIKQEPLTGYGYGLFEKEYNLFQAEYFRTKPTAVIEKANARYVFMPYNDLLEQGIQGGMLGMMLFLSVVVLFVFQAFKQKDTQLSGILLSVAIMSLINFGMQAIPVWMLFLTSAAATNPYKVQKPIFIHPLYSKPIYLAGLCAVLYLGVNQNEKLNAQEKLPVAKQLLHYHKNQKALKLLSDSPDDAGNSEAYFKMYGKILIRSGNFKEAIEMLKKAALYSSSPSLYIDLAYCYEQNSQVKDSEDCLLVVANMVPTNYTSRFMLMKLYEKNNEHDKWLATAREILSLPEKPENKEVVMLRTLAKKVIQ